MRQQQCTDRSRQQPARRAAWTKNVARPGEQDPCDHHQYLFLISAEDGADLRDFRHQAVLKTSPATTSRKVF